MPDFIDQCAVPTLVPIYSHRYMPAAPAPHMAPVFSVYQTDVVYYGENLLDYLIHEFARTPRHPTPGGNVPRIAVWSSLAEGAESAAPSFWLVAGAWVPPRSRP